MFESDVFNVVDEILVSGVNGELLEDLDQEQAEDELDGEVALLRHELQVGPHPNQIAGMRKKKRKKKINGCLSSIFSVVIPLSFGVALAFGVVTDDPLDALPLVPSEQCLEDGWQAVLGHGAKRREKLVELAILA